MYRIAVWTPAQPSGDASAQVRIHLVPVLAHGALLDKALNALTQMGDDILDQVILIG